MAILKGCFNEKCTAHRSGTKFKEEYVYCPICSNELDYVCNDKKCYERLPTAQVLKRYCEPHFNKREEQKQSRKDNLHKVIDQGPKVVVAIGGAVAAVPKVAPKVVDAVKAVAKAIPKK